MNPLITERFEAFEARLLQSPVVAAYEIIRQEVGPTDGKLRVKVTFVNDSVAELFEYVIVTEGQLTPAKYSFHWQETTEKLKYRWDNAPHHPDLPYAPHHRHNADQSVIGMAKVLGIDGVLDEIEADLGERIETASASAPLTELMDELSDKAEARGLTSEKLDELLHAR